MERKNPHQSFSLFCPNLMQTLALDCAYESLHLRRSLLSISNVIPLPSPPFFSFLSVGWLICPCLLLHWNSRRSGCRRISLSRCSHSRQMWILTQGKKCSSVCFFLSSWMRVKKVPNTLLRKSAGSAVHINKKKKRLRSGMVVRLDIALNVSSMDLAGAVFKDFWPFLFFFVWYNCR